MENENNTTEARAPAPELVRPLDGRMIAGVAMGLSNRFDIPDWVIRVAFILTLFAGGLGLILYIACWALIRSEDEAEPPASRFFDNARSPQSWIGIGLIFLAVLLLLDNLTFLSQGVIWAGALMAIGILLYTGRVPLPRSKSESRPGPVETGGNAAAEAKAPAAMASVSAAASDTASSPSQPPPTPPRPPAKPREPRPPRQKSVLGRLTLGTAVLALGVLAMLDILPGALVSPQPRHYLALATTVIGVGLLVGSVWGRARWLILVGAILVPTLLISPFAAEGWRATESYIQPTTVEELQSTYRFEVGTVTLDLTALPINAGDLDIEITGDVGRIRVWVPQDFSVSGQATLDVGSINVPGERQRWSIGGRAIDFSEPAHTQAVGHIRIRASLDVGTIQINRAWVDRSEDS